MARELEVQIVVDGSQAKRELREVDKGVADLTTSANRLGTAFGAALGLSLAGAVATMIGLARAAFDSADALAKMRDKTGINVEALQRLQIAGDDAGNTLEQLTSAINMLQKRIAGDDNSAAKALKQLGINIGDFKTLDAEGQFLAIGQAIQKIHDPAQQVQIAMALFGRTGAEILPTLKRGIADLGEGTVVMSKQTVDALDRAGDAWQRFKRASGAIVGNIAGGTINALFPDAAMRQIRHGGLPTLPDAPAASMAASLAVPGLPHDMTDIMHDLANERERLNAAQREAERADRAAAAALNATVERMAAFRREGVQAAQSINTSVLPVLRDLGVAMGDIQLASHPTTGIGPLAVAQSPQNGALIQAAMKGDTGFFRNLLGNVAKMLNPSTILNTAIGTGLSGLISGGIGLVTSGVGALFSKLFSDPEKTVNPVRQAFIDAAGGLGVLNERAHDAGVTLDRVLNAKNPQQYEAAIKDLNAALDFQDKAMQTLDATVAKYGFTIDQLGPKFRQQKLDEQAAALTQDYQVLIASGIENVTVLEKMAPAMNEYLHTVMTAGGTIPTQLQGPLQKLLDMGLLTDLAGEKMDDLSKLTFAETLDQKFTTLIDTIQKLADAISGSLGGAIANLPDRTVHIGFEVDTPKFLEGDNIERFHRGGVVLPFVRAHTGLAVDEVPIIAQRGEGVLNRGAMRRIGGARGLNSLNAGGGQGVSVSFGEGSVVINKEMTETEAGDLVGRVFTREMRKRGVRFG